MPLPFGGSRQGKGKSGLGGSKNGGKGQSGDKGGSGKNGSGTGGKGQGRGGNPPEGKDGDGDFKNTFLGGKFDLSGKIVGVSSFKGLPAKGEAKAEYKELFKRFKKSAEDTLNKEKIPVEYKDYIKRYFESIRPSKSGSD
jgi:hypothetical protein